MRRVTAAGAVLALCVGATSGCGARHTKVRTTARTVVQRIAVGGAPVGLLAYQGSVWAADAKSDQVLRLDERSGKLLTRTPVGHIPLRLSGLAGRVWSTNWGNGTISAIPTRGARHASTVRLASQPEGISSYGTALWVVSERSGDLVRVPRAHRRALRVHVGSQPRQVIAAGSHLWVSVYADDSVAEVDPASGAVLARVKVCSGPQGLGFAAHQLWVACTNSGQVVDVDPQSHRILRRIPYDAADGIRASASSLLLTSDAGPSTAVLNPRTGTLAHRVRLSNGFIGDANADVVAAGGAVWVSSPDEGVIYRLELSTR